MSDEELNVAINLYVKNAVKANKQIDIAAQGFERLNYGADAARKHATKMFADMDKKAKSMKMSLMGVGFGLLFQGMAIQRFFGGLARSMIETYSLAMGQNSTFANGINMLSGAWEFLKFSIMDALAETGMLDWVIEKVIGLVNWFGTLSPTARVAIGVMVAMGVVLGTVSVIAGQFALSLLAMIEVVSLVKAISFAPLLAKVTAFGTASWAAMAPWLLFGALIAAVIGIAAFALIRARKYTVDWGDAFELMGWSTIRLVQLMIKTFIGLMDPVTMFVNTLIAGYNVWAKMKGKTQLDFVSSSMANSVDSFLGGDVVQQKIDMLLARKVAQDSIAAEDAAYAKNKLASGSTSSNTTNTFNLTQLPGESQDEFINRLMVEIDRRQAMTTGSTAT
jgi:hypothetical protein